jgi:uncharacterized membrane protein YeaQ/YmgE (transglycosylase-associated protein family)
MFFVWYLLIGLAAGWLASLVVRGRGSGFFVNIVVGIIGGLLGGWIVSLFGWYPIGTFSSLVASTIGAIVLLCILSLFTNARRYRDD